MKISAIISEYNPLHNGHLYHISKTRELTNADAVICVMSGNFVQRGLPALIDKWSRASLALSNGVDLVIELPVLYSVSSAEFFSFGAVSLLNSLGVVDYLSFGSETGDINFLKLIAALLVNETPEFKQMLKVSLDEGLPFPAARSKSLKKIISQDKYIYDKNINIYNESDLSNMLNSSNNILGIEYCKSLLSLQSSIEPITIKRQGSSYNSEVLNSNNPDNEYSSATSIRKFLKSSSSPQIDELKNHVPLIVFETLQSLMESNYRFVYPEQMLQFIRYKFFSSKADISALPDVSEGIENKIYNGFEKNLQYQELLQYIKSKRYTMSRISRILCQYFIGFENYDTRAMRKLPCGYARVLGFNTTGAQVLKKIKNNSEFPVYTKLPRTLSDNLKLDIQSTKAYSLLNSRITPIEDYLRRPIIIK